MLAAATIDFPPQIKSVAKKIAEAAETAISAYRSELITDEPSITDRWLGAVSFASGGRSRSRSGVYWRAKTLRASSGKAAEEKRHGADIMGVAEIHVGGEVIRKGFLGQAKRSEPGARMDAGEWTRLQDQCDLMLGITADSFVITYSRYFGIMFIPAITIRNISRRDMFTLNRMTIRQFFEMHLGCFIGDQRLSFPHIKTLDDLRGIEPLGGVPVEHILHIIVTSEATI